MGTSVPPTSPIRRLKYGSTSWSRPRPNVKMSSPSRKNVRFSGKNSGNRVRLVRRVSTSVSAKSVFTVSDASPFGPSRCVTSRLGWNSPSTDAPAAGSAAAGRDRRPDRQPPTQAERRQAAQQPRAAGLRDLVLPPGKRPAVRLEQALDPALDVEVPLAAGPVLKLSVWTGIRISTLHPPARRASPPPRSRPTGRCRSRRPD